MWSKLGLEEAEPLKLAMVLGDPNPNALPKLKSNPTVVTSVLNVHPAVMRLDHEYTEQSLSFAGLKGRDRALAACVQVTLSLNLILSLTLIFARISTRCAVGWQRRGTPCTY